MDDPGSSVALRRRGLLLVASASVVWSTGGLIVRLLDTDSWTTIFWRSLTAAAFLLALLLWREGWRGLDGFRRMGVPGLVVGACFATASIALVVALSLTTVAKTLVILSASPLIAA
jgi:drug/metabolite transporter (DMT)-like permease